MSTRLGGQVNPNSVMHTERASPSDDVWVEHGAVIGDWGLGHVDMWERIILRHEQLLLTGSIETQLWRQLAEGRACSCVKLETQQTAARCPICYGARFVGGFEKHGYETIFIDSSEPSLVLDGLKLKTTLLPFTLELAKDKLTGSFTTSKYDVRDSLGFTGFNLDAYDGPRTTTQHGITVEYKVDGEDVWHASTDTELLNNPNFLVTFRVTLTRPSLTDPSPTFSILRARFQMTRFTTIKITKKSFPEQRLLESFGVSVSASGITWWTTPYAGNPDSKVKLFIQENDLFEIVQGRFSQQPPPPEEYPQSGRFKPSNVMYVEPNGHYLSQRFNIRLLQADEPGEGVF